MKTSFLHELWSLHIFEDGGVNMRRRKRLSLKHVPEGNGRAALIHWSLFVKKRYSRFIRFLIYEKIFLNTKTDKLF